MLRRDETAQDVNRNRRVGFHHMKKRKRGDHYHDSHAHWLLVDGTVNTIVREAVKWVEARKSFSYDLTVPYCLITVWCTDSLASATTGCWTRSTVAGRLFEEGAYIVVENIARLDLHGLKRAHRPVRVRNHPVTRRAPWLEAWPLRWMMMTMTVIGLPSQVYRLVVLLL